MEVYTFLDDTKPSSPPGVVRVTHPDRGSRAAPAESLRRLAGIDEFEACHRLQQRVWGADFRDVVSPVLLMVIEQNGGLVAGAFDGERLLGFVFGFTGREDGACYHWSHMLAVDPDARGRGLGRRLKQFQRKAMLEAGIDTVLWTFDPLVARNAHLNLNRLGASISDYVTDKYGTGTGSRLHASLGTDRFVARWDLDSARVERSLAGGAEPGLPEDAEVAVEAEEGDVTRPISRSPLPDGRAVCVEIPRDIQAVKRDTPEAASRWRELTAAALRHYLSSGYTIDGLIRTDFARCFYLLTRD